MAILELNTELTEQHRATCELVRKFATEMMRPVGVKLDRLHDPADVIAQGSPLYDVFRKYHELGLHKATLPAAVGGLEQDALTGALIHEQLGWGDGGLAIALTASIFPYFFAIQSPDAEVQSLMRQYCDDTEAKLIGCWAITEPEHGSDWLYFTGQFVAESKCAPQVRAVKDGDDYIIKGQKSAWVSNGTIATHAALFLGLEPSETMSRCGIAVVPLNLPGISRGKPLDKLGQRALNQGEIFFDDVRIPKRLMVMDNPDIYPMVIETTLSGANAGMATTWTGVAQSALDEAIGYAKMRIQGGRPICEHQNIKSMLFDMFISVEAARHLSRQVVVYNAHVRSSGALAAIQYAIAAKILATDTAFRVASQAIQIFGGQGLSRDNVIEKIFRDARAAMIEDGLNEVLALAGCDRLLAS